MELFDSKSLQRSLHCSFADFITEHSYVEHRRAFHISYIEQLLKAFAVFDGGYVINGDQMARIVIKF